jgi:hypothetical protein
LAESSFAPLVKKGVGVTYENHFNDVPAKGKACPIEKSENITQSSGKQPDSRCCGLDITGAVFQRAPRNIQTLLWLWSSSVQKL